VVPLAVVTEPFAGFVSAPQFTGAQVGAVPQSPVELHVSVAGPLRV
jgi:hypothetical protein